MDLVLYQCGEGRYYHLKRENQIQHQSLPLEGIRNARELYQYLILYHHYRYPYRVSLKAGGFYQYPHSLSPPRQSYLVSLVNLETARRSPPILINNNGSKDPIAESVQLELVKPSNTERGNETLLLLASDEEADSEASDSD